MRNLTSLLIALVASIGTVSAGVVSQKVAQTTATNFYVQTSSKSVSAVTLFYTETDSNGSPLYYVFNINQADGFVIVSGEDKALPIIGYSTTGQYVIPGEHTNIEYWMSYRKNELISIRVNTITPAAEVTSSWASYSNNAKKDNTHKAMAAVGPLCLSSWDQQYQPYPYNYFMPPTLTGSTASTQSVTGCVATTMAQIMRYWSYPAKGKGSHSYCDCTSGGYTDNWGTLSTNLNHTYNWSVMPLTPATTNKVTTADTDIARLMYDCGVSVEMDYDPSGSGAYVMSSDIGGPNYGCGVAPCAQYSYVKYFSYDSNTIHGVNYPMGTEQAWIDTMEKEFNNNRIIEYEGDETEGGHTWVCDGNDATTPYNQVHMNWGWSAYDDGFFLVTKLDPSGQGTFNSDLAALIGIQPPPGAFTSIPTVTEENNISVYPNPNSGSFTVEMNNVKGKQQLVMYNMLGQNIYGTTLNEGKTEISISQPAGVYLYRILSMEGTVLSEGKLLIK